MKKPINPWDFCRGFFYNLFMASYILISLFIAIFGSGLIFYVNNDIGFWNAVYFSFISAFTVGFGNLGLPTSPWGKITAVLLALVGLLLTGIVIGAAIESLEDI